jgi:hypothetical protein
VVYDTVLGEGASMGAAGVESFYDSAPLAGGEPAYYEAVVHGGSGSPPSSPMYASAAVTRSISSELQYQMAIGGHASDVETDAQYYEQAVRSATSETLYDSAVAGTSASTSRPLSTRRGSTSSIVSLSAVNNGNQRNSFV